MVIKDLTELERNKTVEVSRIKGGDEVEFKLENLGIRPGQKITKLSAHFWRGPITVAVGRGKVAIGHGMAKKILVKDQVED